MARSDLKCASGQGGRKDQCTNRYLRDTIWSEVRWRLKRAEFHSIGANTGKPVASGLSGERLREE